VRVLRLAGMPILQQLRLEEALLRADAGNWFLLNDGTPEPAVVMGISGCVQQCSDRCPLSQGSACMCMHEPRARNLLSCDTAA